MMYDKNISGSMDQGDIIKLKIRDCIPWWHDETVHPVIILTPTCDIEHKKAEHHRFTVLQPFQLLFLSLCTKSSVDIKVPISKNKYGDLKNKIEKVMANDFPRFHFFPKEHGILSIDRFADFEVIGSLPIDSISVEDRIARLRSPFKEQLIHRFSHHGMRIGTEDLPKTVITDKITDYFSSNHIILQT